MIGAVDHVRAEATKQVGSNAAAACLPAPSLLRPVRTGSSTVAETKAARDRAYRVLDAIQAIGWPKDGDQSRRVHLPFARVYYQATRHWLHHLDSHPDAWLGYTVIDHFFNRYVANVTGLEQRRPSPRWQPYFAVAFAWERSQSHHLVWPLLWAGFWAHTRWDLTEAIVLAHRDHVARYGRPPCQNRFRRMMLEGQTDTLFFRAALDYLAAERLHPAGPQSTPSADMATRWACRLSSLWVPMVQRWRGKAWRDACAMINVEHDSGNR